MTLGGFDIGDVIGYRSITGADIKARIVEFSTVWGYRDGWRMLVESIHPQPGYPKGHRWWVRCDSAFVHLIERRSA